MRPEPVEGPPTSAGRSVPVIGLAHGSRHAQGTEAIERLMAALDAPDRPARHAFLDLAEPDLNAVVGELAAAGHRRIVVVPLLFTVAFHTTIDVPQAVVRAAAEHAGVELEVADILGTGDDVAALLLAAAADAGVAPEVSVLLYAVGSSNAAANLAVVELAARLERFDLSRGSRGSSPCADSTFRIGPRRVRHLRPPTRRGAGPAGASRWRSSRCSWRTGCSSTPPAPSPPAMAGRWSSRWGVRAADLVLERYRTALR